MRRLALIADGNGYAGSIAADARGAGVAGDGLVGDHAPRRAAVAPHAPAADARERGLLEPSRRDGAGQLVGIVAITRSLDGFCGPLSKG